MVEFQTNQNLLVFFQNMFYGLGMAYLLFYWDWLCGYIMPNYGMRPPRFGVINF